LFLQVRRSEFIFPPYFSAQAALRNSACQLDGRNTACPLRYSIG
jgi:hypothetical protein